MTYEGGGGKMDNDKVEEVEEDENDDQSNPQTKLKRLEEGDP
jgi:hypothetical protein